MQYIGCYGSSQLHQYDDRYVICAKINNFLSNAFTRMFCKLILNQDHAWFLLSEMSVCVCVCVCVCVRVRVCVCILHVLCACYVCVVYVCVVLCVHMIILIFHNLFLYHEI